MELRYDMLKQCVFVVTAQYEGKKGGLAAAWATQTAKDRILVSVGSQSATRELILASGAFAVNALRSDQLEMSTVFGTRSGRKVDKFQDVPHHVEETGSPVLDGCAAWYD